MLRRLIRVLAVSFVVMLSAPVNAGAAVVPIEMDSSILKAIKNGGYILYLRHGEATLGQDQPDVNLGDCATQRNLSETGKYQAHLIGNIFIEKRIPVQYPVIASPYCRARETAEIALGRMNVSVNPILGAVVNMNKLSVEESQIVTAELAKMFEIPPKPGSNKIIVGHSFPKGQVLGEIPDMGTVVILPKGKGKGYVIAAKLSLDELIKLSSL